MTTAMASDHHRRDFLHEHLLRRRTPVQRVATGLLLFLGVLVVGEIGYMAAGWSPGDSIYMVVITIFGVGYGEVQPVSTGALRVLTIVVGLRRTDGTTELHPPPSTLVAAGDTLVVVGYEDDRPTIVRRTTNTHDITYRGAKSR